MLALPAWRRACGSTAICSATLGTFGGAHVFPAISRHRCRWRVLRDHRIPRRATTTRECAIGAALRASRWTTSATAGAAIRLRRRQTAPFHALRATINVASSGPVGLDDAQGPACTRAADSEHQPRSIDRAADALAVLHGADQFFATHCTTLAPQGLCVVIHMLVQVSSTPCVDETEGSRSSRPLVAASQSAIGSLQHTANPTAINLARCLCQCIAIASRLKAHTEMQLANRRTR